MTTALRLNDVLGELILVDTFKYRCEIIPKYVHWNLPHSWVVVEMHMKQMIKVTFLNASLIKPSIQNPKTASVLSYMTMKSSKSSQLETSKSLAHLIKKISSTCSPDHKERLPPQLFTLHIASQGNH